MAKIAFLFPGQGSQYVGMSQALYNQYDLARLTFEEASDVLGINIAKLCFEGSLADLGKIENAAVVLLTTSVVSFRVYIKEIGIIPQFCAGHSLGEYSALTCSGALKFSDALQIVSVRSQIALELAERIGGAMTIIDGLTAEIVAVECQRVAVERRGTSVKDQIVTVSCYNSSKQVAISGHLDAVRQVEDRVLELGGQITPILGNPPFHCPVMQPAAEQLQKELQKYNFSYIRYPVISNVTSLPYDGPAQVIENLTGHMTRPVQWESTMEFLNKHRTSMVIEMGPKNVLGSLYKQKFTHIEAMSFDWESDRKALQEFFGNQPVVRNHLPTVVTKCLAIATATPNHNLHDEEYQKGVVEPYRRIYAMQQEIETQGFPADIKQMKEALELLRVILSTKKLPVTEQQEWFTEIFEETGTGFLFPDF